MATLKMANAGVCRGDSRKPLMTAQSKEMLFKVSGTSWERPDTARGGGKGLWTHGISPTPVWPPRS